MRREINRFCSITCRAGSATLSPNRMQLAVSGSAGARTQHAFNLAFSPAPTASLSFTILRPGFVSLTPLNYNPVIAAHTAVYSMTLIGKRQNASVAF